MFDYSIIDLKAEKAARQGSKGFKFGEEVAKATWPSFGTFLGHMCRQREAPRAKREGERGCRIFQLGRAPLLDFYPLNQVG